ncbi:uncharacterized protein LOC143228027 isoform X3 [Tachypleus tridentatus]|uniref:uncharacterized protein LOC143228027 isoform X3 n=1 Tax=Tachypleus tridentatus TaxID=6853 RepID=UPI003FD5BADD
MTKHVAISSWSSFIIILIYSGVTESSVPNFVTGYFYRFHAFNETSETSIQSISTPAMRCLQLCLNMKDECLGWKYIEPQHRCEFLTEASDVLKSENHKSRAEMGHVYMVVNVTAYRVREYRLH